ncbi:MAG TPA: hypothetical protein PKE29_15470 [Phycisphaerales bacterium]|nr:hypothetical protein [Phycisphaerales bacterium]
MSQPVSSIVRTVAAIAIGGFSLLCAGLLMGGQSRPMAAAPSTYAELTKSSDGWSGNPGGANAMWQFSDGHRVVPPEAIRAEFKIGRDDRSTATELVNAIADRGWDLLSHSECSVCTVPDVREGTSMGSGRVYVTERWWFKRR